MRPNNVSTTPTAFMEMPVQRQGSMYLQLFPQPRCSAVCHYHCGVFYVRGMEIAEAWGPAEHKEQLIWTNQVQSCLQLAEWLADPPKSPLSLEGGPMGLCGRWRRGALLAMRDGGVGASAPHVPAQSRLGRSVAWCGCVNHLCFGCARSMVL